MALVAREGVPAAVELATASAANSPSTFERGQARRRTLKAVTSSVTHAFRAPQFSTAK
jgi:hypothetical protein